MQFRYLPYTSSRDAHTRTWCAEGLDACGEPFGVGAGSTPESAQHALREYVLESLVGAAADSHDLTRDLTSERPIGDHLAFSPQELLPVALRAARVRQHLRQADMAARLGLTQQAYQKLERPGANPTLATLIRLEQAVGVALLVAV
jgi:DNA-binding XRE family transcriptional regulator